MEIKSTPIRKSGARLPSSDLLGRLAEITDELCADYPLLAAADDWERLYALEQTHRGTLAANADLHALIEKLRIRCGMTKEEVAELGWPNVRVDAPPSEDEAELQKGCAK